MVKGWRKTLIALLCLVMILTLMPKATNATIGYGTGDWSNGYGWWSQHQSAVQGVRDYGCLIVAMSKMLVASGCVTDDCNSFNPDIYYHWAYASGCVNDGMYTTAKGFYGPTYYAEAYGKTLTYEGTLNYSDEAAAKAKIWENANAGKFTILRTWKNNSSDGTSHYVLVNHWASLQTGRIRVFQSGSSCVGTMDWNSPTRQILTYSVPSTPSPTTYTVTYNANGGSPTPPAQTKTQGQALTLSSTKPTRANASAGSYTVTLDPNGGNVDTTSLSAARTTSYTFKNWNTSQNGGGTAYASGASYTTDANVTLYAQWNSSTSTASVTLPTPWRYGYTFKGWGTSSTATSGVTGSYKPAKNLTLYAVWEKEDISGWMTSKPNGIDDEYIETATQYRYSDRTVTGGWTQTGSGTIDYVQSWPSGFNTSHSLYSQYNKTPKTAGTTGNKKIEVNSNTFLTYIYWHWTYNNAYTSGGNFNVFISDVPYETDSSGRYYQYFTAFTSATDAGHVDPNGRNGGDCFYMWRDINSDGSWWWFRIPVYRQTYTEYTGSNSSETWSDWSDWTLISYATGENRKSQTRTVYRYKSNGSTGWLNLGGKWVYLSESGAALTSWQKLSGKWYYFDNSGVMQTGWRKVNGKWYCFATGDGGYMLTGWQKLDGKWYYFNPGDDGSMVTGWKTLNGKKYYFNPGDDGSMVTGWKKLDGKWYYFNTGNDGSMVTGWQTLSGKRYYFSSDGSMVTGWQKLSGKWYYFKPGDDGSMVTGWQTLGGKKYYFNSDGSMATGWQKLSGKWYCFATGDSGYMLTGWQKLNNKWYYFNTDGSMVTGWKKLGTKWYYFLPGDNGQMVTGWKQIDGDWYYFMPGNDGSMVTGTMTIDGKSYTFASNGVCTNP